MCFGAYGFEILESRIKGKRPQDFYSDGLFVNYGDGGIRTHVPLRTT